MMKAAWLGNGVGGSVGLAAPAPAPVRGKPVYAVALHGEPKFGPTESFPYNNVNAPKGGSLRLQAPTPTFDTFNPYSLKGVPAAGFGVLGGNGFLAEGLTVGGDD